MADFKAFKALRPAPEKAEAVAAVPYDVVNRAEARLIGEKNPDSFLHVDRAEMDLDPEVDLYSTEVYERAAQNLKDLETSGRMIRDSRDCYYLYELTRLGKVQTGVVGCASIDDYKKDIVKKHEKTRADKEQDRINHVDFCNANTGPIFLAARFEEETRKKIAEKKMQTPVYDFVADDGIGHRVWVVDEPELIEELKKAFERMDGLYIADGHHRAASAVRVGEKRRAQAGTYDGTEEFNHFLAVVFPYDELLILAYNRVVHDLNGNTPQSFLEKIGAAYEIREIEASGQPEEKHTCILYLQGKWYELRAKAACYAEQDVVGQLDVSILQDQVLSSVLGIEDPRTSSRISFVGGSHGNEELAAMADEKGGAAFIMYPTSMEDLMKIADENKLMPPKSTWFEPKLRSGLFVHSL